MSIFVTVPHVIEDADISNHLWNRSQAYDSLKSLCKPDELPAFSSTNTLDDHQLTGYVSIHDDALICHCETNVPMPVCIMQKTKKGKVCTTVQWNDGTYTTVKVSENDKKDESPYVAFCAALAKKLYGSNTAIHRIVNRHTSSYLEEQKKIQERELKAKEECKRQTAHDRAVRMAAKRLRIQEEAMKYNMLHSS